MLLAAWDKSPWALLAPGADWAWAFSRRSARLRASRLASSWERAMPSPMRFMASSPRSSRLSARSLASLEAPSRGSEPGSARANSSATPSAIIPAVLGSVAISDARCWASARELDARERSLAADSSRAAARSSARAAASPRSPAPCASDISSALSERASAAWPAASCVASSAEARWWRCSRSAARVRPSVNSCRDCSAGASRAFARCLAQLLGSGFESLGAGFRGAGLRLGERAAVRAPPVRPGARTRALRRRCADARSKPRDRARSPPARAHRSHGRPPHSLPTASVAVRASAGCPLRGRAGLSLADSSRNSAVCSCRRCSSSAN